MKRSPLLLIVCCSALALQAQQQGLSYAKSITKYGGAFTVGDNFARDNLGYGLTTMSYRFFDPLRPWGFYYGLGGTDIRHTVGGVLIGDMRPATIGWRRETAGSLGLDLSLSPVLGSRTVGNTIFGNLYLGAKPMVGAFLVLSESIDIEVAYEPVIHIVNISGREVRNKTYHDFSLYLMLKKFRLVRDLGWNSKAP